MEMLLALSGIILTPVIVGVLSRLVFGQIYWKWIIWLLIVAVVFRVNIYYQQGKRISSDPIVGSVEAATPLVIALIIYLILAIIKKKKLKREDSGQ